MLVDPPQDLKKSSLSDIAFNPVTNGIALLFQYRDHPTYKLGKFFIIELGHNQSKIVATHGNSDKYSFERNSYASGFDIDSKGNYHVLGNWNVNEAEIYVLAKEEGGRHTPFFTGYKPQFYMRTTDVTGEVTLAEGVEMVMPGDTVTFKVKLVAPVALEEQQRFAIREGGKTVGAGVVTKVVA